MYSNSYRLLIMRYFIYTVCLFLCIASFGFADVPIESMSGNVLGDMLEKPADEEFGEFDEFDEFDDQDVVEINDPLSGYNRFMTQVNDTMITWLLKPIAQGYSFIVREPVRR